MMPTHALVLAAGLGLRLRPLTLVRAKPAVPVAGEPLARRIVRSLVAQGVTEVTVNLHYLPETIAACLGDGSDLGASIRYSWEQPLVLGSAGGPRRALDIVGAETFFLINGDTMTDVSLRDVADSHARSGALVTLALVPNTEPDRYGGVQVSAEGHITGFVPRGPRSIGSFHFIGVQVVQREVFAALSPTEPAASIGGVYERFMTARPGSVRGVITNSRFWDIGTVSDYQRTSQEWFDGEGFPIGEAVDIDATARVSGSILWDNVTIGPGAHVDGCIVTDGVTIPRDASHRGAILWRDPHGNVMSAPLTAQP